MMQTNENELDPNSTLRRGAYVLLTVVALSTLTARIMVVRASTGETPMLSANDRSRWGTIRALVDDGSYEIDDVIRERHPTTGRRHWHTIDRVRHKGWDGQEHDYSSKPPLLPTLLAGQYWLIKQLLGMRMDDRPEYVMRVMLVLTNVLPLGLYFLLLARMVDRLGQTDLGRLLVMTTATFGTFLTTWGVTLNNHLPGAICALLAVDLALAVWRDRRGGWWSYAGAGLFSALAVTCELPALALLGLVGLALLWKSPSKTLLAFTPATLLVAAAFLGTNYVAHGSWRPPYAHRADGPLVAEIKADPLPQWPRQDERESPVPGFLREALADRGIDVSSGAVVYARGDGERSYVLWDLAGQDRLALELTDHSVLVRRWDDWYDYKGSYWTSDRRQGVDRGEPSRLAYAFHVLCGHHGVFSLTPVWILAVIGAVMMLKDSRLRMRGFAAMVLILTVICLAFYIARPEIDRNYGGVTSGFRWMFWFIPLWTIAMIPAADAWSRRRWSFVAAVLLLAVSVFSAHYSAMNPWVHPWIYTYWEYLYEAT